MCNFFYGYKNTNPIAKLVLTQTEMDALLILLHTQNSMFDEAKAGPEASKVWFSLVTKISQWGES